MSIKTAIHILLKFSYMTDLCTKSTMQIFSHIGPQQTKRYKGYKWNLRHIP